MAFAADIPMESMAPMAPAPMAAPFSWTGLYLGVAAGGGAINYDTDFDFSPLVGGFPAGVGFDSFGGEGWLAEASIGADYQAGRFVFGIIADASWSDLESSADLSIGPDIGVGPFDVFTADASLTKEWGWDVLARAGFLVNDRALLYVLGGYSYGDFEGEFDLALVDTDAPVQPNPLGGDSESEDSGGWTIGGGIEAMLTDSLSVKGEYRYTHFDSLDFGTDIVDIDPSTHTARVGVNYKFNGLFQ
jgi:outer membrane immunogenic protein